MSAPAAPPPSPSANPLLFGHGRAERVLLRAWRGGRLPHAWLLRGPAGVGKATLAYRFARRLLADPGDAGAADDPAHPVFRMVANGAHPDLRAIRRGYDAKKRRWRTTIVVEQVRELIEDMYRTAALARGRVLIVDPIDDVTGAAENALLKLLEEPPPGVVLLLVCQAVGAVRPTIRSRCAQLALAPLQPVELAAALRRLAPGLGVERLAALGQLAGGSPGRALELEANGWLEGYGELLAALARARGGEAARLGLLGPLGQLVDRLGFRGTADLLGVVLRRLAHLGAGRAPGAELVAGEAGLLRALASGHGLDRWLGLWEKLAASARRVDALNLDPLVALLPLALGLCGGVDVEAELGIT